MHRVYEDLAGHRLAFIYSGSFPDEHTAGLITLGEEIVAMGGLEKGGRNKLAFVLVEAYQNIVRHRANVPKKLERTAGRCLFLVMDGVDHQEVIALDPVPKAEVKALADQLASLQGQGPAQLKELFLGRLRNEQRSARGGAGLGLIEMSRRSGNALEHAFSPLDEEHEMFLLKARLGVPFSERSIGWDLTPIRDTVLALDIIVLCKGRLTAAIQELLLHVLEKEVREDGGDPDTMAKAYLAANVLLGSFGREERPPMIAMCRTGGRHTLVVGMPMTEAEANTMSSDLAQYSEMKPSELQRQYRNVVLGRGEVAPGTLSLLDLVRTSREPVHWSMHGPEGNRLMQIEVTC